MQCADDGTYKINKKRLEDCTNLDQVLALLKTKPRFWPADLEECVLPEGCDPRDRPEASEKEREERQRER